MPRRIKTILILGVVVSGAWLACGQNAETLIVGAKAAPPGQPSREAYEKYALEHSGDTIRGWQVFTNEQAAACIRCHTIDGSSGRVGPDLSAIGDKFSRQDLIRAVLDPSAAIAVGYDTTILETSADEEYQGVIKQATDAWIELMGWDAKTFRVATAEVVARRTAASSFMPANLENTITPREFTDLIAYLQTRQQPANSSLATGATLDSAPLAANPVSLRPFFNSSVRLEHPLWFGAVPGRTNWFVVLEHGGKSWLLERKPAGDRQTLLVDLSGKVRMGGATGLLGLAFHPKFAENRRYFLKYQILENGRIVTLVVERRFAADFCGDSGEAAREIIRIPGVTQDHNGGCITFGPDGYLYLGMGDTGPQRDPQGHGQDLKSLLGKMLRIDVDHPQPPLAYGIPTDNPFVTRAEVRPEIWAYGFRSPWRFSFDPATDDLWVGDVGQDRVEEVTIARAGENHGWNVFEGADRFSDQYRRATETYIPPVFSYSHRIGVSVTAGYVYRGKRTPALAGYYICGDFETRRIWALTQTNRHLASVVEIGRSPSRISSFGCGPDGEIFLVGYDDGVIYQLDLSPVNPVPLEVKILAETSERTPVRWRYTVQTPAREWFQPQFDDAAWNYGPGGFGTRGTPGAVVRTDWSTGSIWLRREFNLENTPSSAAQSINLRLHHDEDAEIYVNGVEAARLPRWTSGYVEVGLSPEAVRTLHPGRNVLAIHCRQNSGGQYIDAGLVELIKRGP